MNTNTNSNVSHDHELDNYERNRWFRGKMVTARDLNAEWEYHADRLNTLTRFSVGDGVVCGLETAVSRSDPTTLSVEVSPGLGIDSVGRHLVVRRKATRDIDVSRTEGRVSLYLTYRECGKESVPTLDGGNACDDDRCEYNRILETFDVTVGDAPPEEYGRVRPVDFPSLSSFPEGYESLEALRSDDTGDGDATGDSPEVDERAVYRRLYRMARSYNESDGVAGERLRPCSSGKGPLNRTDDGSARRDQPAVFLGTFVEDGGAWSRDESVPLRFVATQDMLHDALVDHAARFDNPHQVRLDAALDLNSNGLLFAARETDPEPVTFSSSDGNVEYRLSSERELDLTVPDMAGIQQTLATLQDDVATLNAESTSLRRYVLGKTMRNKLESYGEVSEALEERIPGDIADEIIARTMTGIDGEWFANAADFGRYLFEADVTLTFPSERVSGTRSDDTLTLTETDPGDPSGEPVSHSVPLETQEFGASDVTIADGAVTITTSVFGLETLFAEVLGDLVPSVALERYRGALAEFEGVPRPNDADAPAQRRSAVLEHAVLQDQLCDAVDRLVEPETTVDTRPVGSVFLGQTGVNLSAFRKAPTSGTVRLFDVTDPADDGIEVNVTSADITADAGFEPGSYGFEESRSTASVTVDEPEIASLSVTVGGEDATTKPIPSGTEADVEVRATFNFSSVERLRVTVTNNDSGEDVTETTTGNPFLRDASDSVELDVSDLGLTTYTVTVAGEQVFPSESRSASFAIEDSSIRFAFEPSTVVRENVTTGKFVSSGEGSVFVLVPRKSYENPEIFDNPRIRDVLEMIFTGDAVKDVGVSETHIFAELTLSRGRASFNFNSGGLRVTQPRHGVSLRPHIVTISKSEQIDSPPSREDLAHILATAPLAVRDRRDFPINRIILSEDPDDVVTPRDPGDIFIRDPTGGGVIIRNPAGGGEVIVHDSISFDPFRNPVRPDNTAFDSDLADILDDIDGIGDVRARRLVEAGVTDLSSLAEADSARLAEAAGVSVEMAASWREQARDRIGR